ARMFDHNPELRQVFNQGHQQAGTQQQALAMAVAAYAEHIDDPSVLAPVLERIAHKHVSLGIRAEHYPIVGKHLLASIREVLGEAATDELVQAWALAYGQLADVLIGVESKLYTQAAGQDGGWSGWRGFKVLRKVQESEEITSIHLAPADGGPLPRHRPGQYISVRTYVPGLDLMQPRQYSLSVAPGQANWRISVKRETGGQAQVPGWVSHLLHDQVQVGQVIDVAPPMGDFFLHEDRDTPVVLISGGVGITPMIAMLDHLLQAGSGGQAQRQIRFLHACRDAGVQAFGEHLSNVQAEYGHRLQSHVFHELPQAQKQPGVAFEQHAGRITPQSLSTHAVLPEADYYVCGPIPFMQAQIAALQALGVPADRIHAEAFGTGGVSVN
ncbi:MAG: NO-inducible flavohemoprotein, partial [Aquabacterium sp.]